MKEKKLLRNTASKLRNFSDPGSIEFQFDFCVNIRSKNTKKITWFNWLNYAYMVSVYIERLNQCYGPLLKSDARFETIVQTCFFQYNDNGHHSYLYKDQFWVHNKLLVHVTCRAQPIKLILHSNNGTACLFVVGLALVQINYYNNMCLANYVAYRMFLR